ncbi:unnamed protein product [Urochloa humidicola]
MGMRKEKEKTKKRGAAAAAPPMKMPRDDAGRGLEVEAALAAEAAWELREAVTSMAGTGSLDMEVDSPQLLTVDAGGDVSILAPGPSTLNKFSLRWIHSPFLQVQEHSWFC